MTRVWKYCLLVALLLSGALSAVAADPAPLFGLAQDGDDPPALLVPARERDEQEQDHITASALYAHGRLLLQREDYAGALRRYQRAYRYDPQARHVLNEIVPLAFELDHNEEAARYAIISAETDPKDALLLRRLAMHLTEQQDYARALKLYQRSFELQKDADDVTSILLHMEIGRLQFLQREYKPAAEAFARVREAIVDPKKFGLSEELQKILLGNAHATYSLLGECFLQAEKYEDAAAMFEKANAAQADEPRLAFHLARIAHKQKKPDEALTQLDKYFAEKGSSAGVEPYDMLAELLKAKLEDDKQAADQFSARLKVLYEGDNDNIPLAYAYARTLRDAGKLDEATPILEKTTEKETTAEVAQLLAGIYRQQGNSGGLLAILGKSVGKSGSLDTLGDAGKELVKDAELVKKLFASAREKRAEKAENLTPGEALSVALLAMEIRDYDAADEFYAIVADKPPAGRGGALKAEIVLTWGVGLLQAEQYDRAVRVFTQAIEKQQLKEREELVYYFLAGAHEMQGKTDEALAAIDKALAAGKPSIRLQSRRAWIQYHAKRYEDAEKSYLELLSKFDKDHKSAEVRETLREARLVLSNICVQTDRRQEGIEYLEQVLDEFPEDVGAMNDLGYLWAERGERPRRALKMTQFAVAAEPDNAAYRDSLGWAYYQLGRYAEAIAELENAAAKDEPDGVILDHLGDAYHKHGQAEKALAAWQRAITAFEKEKDEAKLKATREKIAAQKK